MSQASPARLFADVYDSVQQATNIIQGDKQLALCYQARLRLDSFLYQTTILTDSEILDGVFFQDAANDSILDRLPLGRLEIRSRAETLDEALIGMLRDPTRATLRGVLFSSLANNDAIRVALREYPSVGVNNWRMVPKILVDVGVEKAEAERLENAWAEMIRLAASGRLTVKKWKTNFSWGTEFEGQLMKDKEHVEKSLVSQLGKDIAQTIWRDKEFRTLCSQVDGLLREANSASNAEELADLATVTSWYHTAYNQTIAEQHDCGTTDISDKPGGRPIDENQMLFDQVREQLDSGAPTEIGPENILDLPIGFVHSLAKLPKQKFVEVINKHEVIAHAPFVGRWRRLGFGGD
jgi:hypothetical protein